MTKPNQLPKRIMIGDTVIVSGVHWGIATDVFKFLDDNYNEDDYLRFMFGQGDLTIEDETPTADKLERARLALKELASRNPIRHDAHAYDLALAKWGLGLEWSGKEDGDERPKPEEYGLEPTQFYGEFEGE